MASQFIQLPLHPATITGTVATTQAALVPSFQEITNLTNAMQTFTAPAGAARAKIQTDDTNSVNIRYKCGANATTTSGHQLQPGRSDDIEMVGATITVIAESAAANQKICVTFGV